MKKLIQTRRGGSVLRRRRTRVWRLWLKRTGYGTGRKSRGGCPGGRLVSAGTGTTTICSRRSCTSRGRRRRTKLLLKNTKYSVPTGWKFRNFLRRGRETMSKTGGTSTSSRVSLRSRRTRTSSSRLRKYSSSRFRCSSPSQAFPCGCRRCTSRTHRVFRSQLAFRRSLCSRKAKLRKILIKYRKRCHFPI